MAETPFGEFSEEDFCWIGFDNVNAGCCRFCRVQVDCIPFHVWVNQGRHAQAVCFDCAVERVPILALLVELGYHLWEFSGPTVEDAEDVQWWLDRLAPVIEDLKKQRGDEEGKEAKMQRLVNGLDLPED